MELEKLVRQTASLWKQTQLSDPHTEIGAVMPLPEGATEENVLYLSDTIPAQCPSNFVTHAACYGDGNWLQLRESVSLAQAQATLSGLLLAQFRIYAATGRLMQIQLSGQGMQAMLDEAAQLLGNPLAVLDASSRCLVASRASGAVPAFPSASLATDIAALKGRSGMQQLRHSAALGCPLLCVGLPILGTTIGYLVLAAVRQEIAPAHNEIFRTLSRMAAQELQRFEITQRGSHATAGLLTDLLEDRQPITEQMQRHLRTLGIRPNDYYLLAVIDTETHALSMQQARPLEWLLGSYFPKAICAYYHGQFVMLLPFADKREEQRQHLTTLQDIVQENHLLAGTSNCFTDLSETQRFYHQAQQALYFGCRVPVDHPYDRVFQCQSYSFVEMLEICRRNTELTDFCHPLLLELLDYDRQNGTELMNTLFEFLYAGGNVPLAASQLFVHKNTLFYRMNRIRSILQNDLSDPWDLFMLNLSFRVLMYLGIYRPDRAVKSWAEMEKQPEK